MSWLPKVLGRRCPPHLATLATEPSWTAAREMSYLPPSILRSVPCYLLVSKVLSVSPSTERGSAWQPLVSQNESSPETVAQWGRFGAILPATKILDLKFRFMRLLRDGQWRI